MSQRVLIAYASVTGSTGEVAQAIGQVIESDNVAVQVAPVRDIDDLGGFDAVVLGSSIRAGKWLPEAFRFLEMHQEALSQAPVAYFTTCLTLVDDTEDSRRTVLAYMEPVLQAAPKITPVGLGLFAGSLDPNRTALPMLRSDLAPQGDYRDWDSIKAWAREIRPALLLQSEAFAETVILRDAVLSFTDMSGLDLSNADLSGAKLRETKLTEADLQGANLGESQLTKADLSKADLQEAGLNWADLNWADMSKANLTKANLIGADLNRANLDHANLQYAILNGANLNSANLNQADLSYADLNWADLRGADLSNANLSYANLGWANLSGANLSQANLNQAKYNTATEWPEDFSPEAHGCVLIHSVE